MTQHRNFYIGGAWVAPRDGRDCPVHDPSTEEVVTTISLGGQADTDAAVAAAQAAFLDWSQRPVADRLALFGRIAAAYEARSDDMARAISTEMGAPIDWARGPQVGAGAAHIRDAAAALEACVFEAPLGGTPGTLIRREPVGVCALITPWNWPMNQITLKVLPALAAGCTMVLKPSEVAPLSALVFAEIMDEAGTPPGVFNMLNGDGAGVGTQLSAHPGIDMVSFTGSSRAGRAISRAAAETLKRVALELGGKGANIIFDDAPDRAIQMGARRCFNNTGQSCNAPTRMLVSRARYDSAVEIAVQAAETTSVGPASEPGRHIGPLVSAAQWDKVQGLIETGIAEGARLVAGGPGRPEGLNRGWFARPTVFADVTNDMTIAREEIFGPVLSIIAYDDEDDAIRIANDTPYGLTNYVQTEDPARLRRVGRALRSGMVEMNAKGFGPGFPFGGMKQSGHGREGGAFGLEEFLEVKAISGWPAG
ncbi:aldehyde dehydrogenase family protein [Meridianimarinicoccus roseus]|uniref:aldehyde dehydrogenase (NAD(+)) n=1 Tax=Meridianimarinicoccus roseus TaxID=2072018 RepID=A0A2V2L8X2_9RHOB|nr:aldehyde dehydrogenase family protein [Meridianimarinicoccus roseus]PWR01840.1 aldehyde dehydrogenase family protein [Meridianimarinicoccus roseus]